MTRVYEYDVFISYQREGNLVPAWVRTHFYPRLRELLDDHLDREVSIFFDENLHGGARWPLEVRRALQRARILVPVCSPKYFLSEWCLAEWHSMARREELVRTASPEESRTLIYPVIFCDSRNFPAYAHERRMQDLKTWNAPYEHFMASPAYLDFHHEVARIAEELEVLIERAPEWRPDWPVDMPAPGAPRPSELPRF
ncbi:TIR domain-containing protein [Amycolatopsis minnesotensis]|uniref:TIR domain-containing protein n=1 Tax=Amycolatopsis minnesotensis TaxID=337894 RepID=A0ABN2SNS1_9PSEU